MANCVKNLEKRYNALVEKIKSALPDLKDCMDQTEYLQKRVDSLATQVFLNKTEEEKHFEELKKSLAMLGERLAWVEALSHRHLFQSVRRALGVALFLAPLYALWRAFPLKE